MCWSCRIKNSRIPSISTKTFNHPNISGMDFWMFPTRLTLFSTRKNESISEPSVSCKESNINKGSKKKHNKNCSRVNDKNLLLRILLFTAIYRTTRLKHFHSTFICFFYLSLNTPMNFGRGWGKKGRKRKSEWNGRKEKNVFLLKIDF